MAREREFQGRTLEEAIAEAARFLSVPEDAVHYRLVDEGRLGVLGFGARPVRIVVEAPERSPHAPAPAAKAPEAIGYLPEQPPVYRDLTVDEYLDTCAALNRIERGKRRAAREAAKTKCGLGDVGRRLIGNLSKGYQQRVGIAQAIIHLPPVIILDEPTAGLDPIQIREIRNLIRELGKDHSVILSTHILPEVQGVCNHVQIISHGTLVLDDSIEGLTQRMQSSVLVLRFRHVPERKVLTTLAGVDCHLRLLASPAKRRQITVLGIEIDRDAGPGVEDVGELFRDLRRA